MTRKAADEKELRRIIIAFHKGRVGRAEIARQIHSHSTSISFKSLIRSLRLLFPGARIAAHETELRADLLCATQPRMEKKKYELVCLLFDETETFDSYNRAFFDDHPIAVMHIGGGHYAILDGHHRVRRYIDLTGGSRPITVTVITADSDDLTYRFRREVEDVRRESGTTDVVELPLV